jgi:hypothetical protein
MEWLFMFLTYSIQMPYNSHVNIFISQMVQDVGWDIQVLLHLFYSFWFCGFWG